MPFDLSGLSPLLTAGSFTLWRYASADSRIAVLAPGYFTTAADRLHPGHLVILQASDAMAFLPVREDGTVGSGLVLDTGTVQLRLNRSAIPRFGVTVSLPPLALTATALLHEAGGALLTEAGHRLVI